MALPTEEDCEELLLSCRYGDLDDVKQFIEKFGAGAVANTRDENGNTVLHMASANGHLGKPQPLPDYYLSFIYMIAGKALDVVDYLLPLVPSSFLAVKNTNAESTALHWAALNSHSEIVKRLVEYPGGPGIELIDIKNKSGLSPLGEAEMAGWDEGASWLVGKMNLEKVAGATTEAEDEPIASDQAIEVEIQDADGGVAKMTLKP